MPGGGLGWFGFLVPYFVGTLLGKLVHRIAGFKLGKKIVTTIVVGLIVGMLVSPLSSDVFQMVVAMFKATPDSDGDMPGMSTITYLLYSLGPAVIFVFGVLSPIINGYRRAN